MAQPADGSTTKATFEVWINPEELENNVGIITKWDNNYEPDRRSYFIVLKNAGQFEIGVFSGTWYSDGKLISAVTDDNLLSTGMWQHIAVVVDLSTKNIDLYYNGEEKSSTIISEGGPPDYFYDIDVNEWLGRYQGEGGNAYYNGFMDEAKISKTCRSASWISTEYNNQNNPSSFFSVGPEES